MVSIRSNALAAPALMSLSTAGSSPLLPAWIILSLGDRYVGVDIADGRRLWERPIDGETSDLPVTQVSNALLTKGERGIALLDIESGRPRWGAPLVRVKDYPSSCVVTATEAAANYRDGSVYTLDLKDGTIISTLQIPNAYELRDVRSTSLRILASMMRMET